MHSYGGNSDEIHAPPSFPSEEVNRNLESSIASKRQKGFALAEAALTSGAPIPRWTMRIVEGLALRSNVSREDRWRAVDLLRSVTIRDEVRTALLREWALSADSTVGPFEHDSGPMFRVLHDPGPALDEAFSIISAGDLTSINRLVLRDLLYAMRDRLQNQPELVSDDQGQAWSAFCQSCRSLDPAPAALNEQFLIDAIIKAIDG